MTISPTSSLAPVQKARFCFDRGMRLVGLQSTRNWRNAAPSFGLRAFGVGGRQRVRANKKKKRATGGAGRRAVCLRPPLFAELQCGGQVVVAVSARPTFSREGVHTCMVLLKMAAWPAL